MPGRCRKRPFMRAVLIALMRRRHHIGIVRDLSFRWITLELPNWSSWSSQCRCGVSQADSAEETTLPVTGGLNSVRTDRGRRHCIALHCIASHCSQDRHCAGRAARWPSAEVRCAAGRPSPRMSACQRVGHRWGGGDGRDAVLVVVGLLLYCSPEIGRAWTPSEGGTVLVKSICPSRKCSGVSRSLRRWPKKERAPNVGSELPAFSAY